MPYLKNANELSAVISEHFRLNTGPLVLYVASPKFNEISEHHMVFKPIIGFHDHHTYNDMMSERDLFLFWNEEGQPHLRQFSLLDRNMPENGYNDWRVFTNKSEAEEYVNPAQWEVWEVGNVYIQKAEPRQSWNIPGHLECVFIDHIAKQVVLRNLVGLHIAEKAHITSFKCVAKPAN